MSKFEQFLKPPTNINNEEEMCNESQEGEEEMNNYNQNEDNSYDNGNQNQNIENENENDINDLNDINNERLQNLKNKFQKNFENEEENSEIIQGINSLNNIGQKNPNQNLNEEQNEYDIKENNNFNDENIEPNYMNMNLNEIKNNNNNSKPFTSSPDDIMNELLFKIRKLKGNRTMQKSDIINSNEININNDLNKLQRTIKNDKINSNKNEYLGKLNMNNQIIQNNPKMKEVAYLIKDYNQDKNKNDNIQLNFYNNNQINILKPDVFFNMGNQKKQNNDEFNIDNTNNQNKHYISIIDGKAIINGQRINVTSGFQTTPNSNFVDRKINFGNYNFNNNKNRNKNLFNFENERRSFFVDNKINLDFKLQNMKKKYSFNNIENSKNNYKRYYKNSFFTKEFYNEELNKINENLFNINNERFNIRK